MLEIDEYSALFPLDPTGKGPMGTCEFKRVIAILYLIESSALDNILHSFAPEHATGKTVLSSRSTLWYVIS